MLNMYVLKDKVLTINIAGPKATDEKFCMSQMTVNILHVSDDCQYRLKCSEGNKKIRRSLSNINLAVFL